MIDDEMRKAIIKFFRELNKEIKNSRTKEQIEEKIKENFN
jgi:hypothetical protein